jgi:Fe-Mn family superoxide dismutase
MYELPKLRYGYDALEPWIDTRTMEFHHGKHHQTYVNKLNEAVGRYPALEGKPIEELLMDPTVVPEDIRGAVKNHGGGHWNHSFFWKVMAPQAGGEAKGEIGKAIERDFGSDFGIFRKKFNDAALGLFGSGWVWLVADKSGKLAIVQTANQETPIANNQKPLLCLDVWEHAYYLKYQNRRPDYVEAWWNLVNWEQVEENFK